MKNPDKMKERILETVSLDRVLLDYHVEFVSDPGMMSETQLRCPFHGQDNKPSARYYRETQTMYCWVCMKVWDVINFIKEKEQLGYIRTLFYIVERYRLDISDLPENPEFEKEIKKGVPKVDVEMILLKEKIKGFRGKLPFEKYRTLCIAYDILQINLMKKENIVSDLARVRQKIDSIG